MDIFVHRTNLMGCAPGRAKQSAETPGQTPGRGRNATGREANGRLHATKDRKLKMVEEARALGNKKQLKIVEERGLLFLCASGDSDAHASG